MNRRAALETDLESHRPKQEVIPGLGLVKSTIFFIFSYLVLGGILKNEIDGLETVFLGIVAIGTFYIFLRKYDSDEVEAYALYLLNSLWFWVFSRGVKKLNVVRDVRDDYFILQNGGLRAVIEVFSDTDLSRESQDSVARLVGMYSNLLETFSQYFQLVVRIRKVSPRYLVVKALKTDETPMAREFMKQFGRHGVTSFKVYIVLAADPPRWYYLERRDEKSLRRKLEEQAAACMRFLSMAEFVSSYRRLENDRLLDFVFDENFYQNRGREGKENRKPVILDRISRKLHEGIGYLTKKAEANRRVSGILASRRYVELSRKAEEALTATREFFQVPESDMHPALRTIGDFYATKDTIHCNGIYVKSLLVKFLPERDPAFIVQELLKLSRNIDISFHLYPDEGSRIRKILGRYYRTVSEQMEEMGKKGSVSLTTRYQERRLKETYYASLGGRNLFLATVLVTVYDFTPRRLSAGVGMVRKALRPAGLATDPLTFRQEQAFLSAIPLGIDRIGKFTAIDVEKLAGGSMPFVEESFIYGGKGVPIGVELREGA